tara:strand:+ start:970 stop:2100 length:1131 start_codon:yes stop_codon:yes gene_type:complete
MNFTFKRNNFNCKKLYVTNTLESGGAEKILFQLIKDSNKSDISIISLTSLGTLGRKLINKGFRVYALNIRKDFISIFKIFKLLYLIATLKPLILHSWLYHSNLIAGIFAKITGVKKVYWSIHHDYESSTLIMMLEMKLLMVLSYLVPDKIIFSSFSSKINHINNGYKKSNSIIIENGVSTEKFKKNKTTRKKLRLKLGIQNDCFIIGNIARYHPIKDHDNLLKALKILSQKKVNFKCILVGRGLSSDNKELLNKINYLDLNDRVILFGQTNKIHRIINIFDLNILTSKMECSPLSLLESMAVGIPCMSTNVGDAKCMIGETGWIIETSNPFQIAEMIYRIYKNPSILKSKSNLTRQRVKDLYEIKDMIQKYLNVYQ